MATGLSFFFSVFRQSVAFREDSFPVLFFLHRHDNELKKRDFFLEKERFFVFEILLFPFFWGVTQTQLSDGLICFNFQSTHLAFSALFT